MDVKISCDTYYRLSQICRVLHPLEQGEMLKSVYIERKDNRLFAVAVNRWLAAIEFLGDDKGPDGGFTIVVNEQLQTQAETEKNFSGEIFLSYNEPLQFLTLKTSLGFMYTGNACHSPGDNGKFPEWRDWLPDTMPKKPAGAMYLPTTCITDLLKASPSGKVVFPRVIDANKPVVIRDIADSNWVGVFMPVYVKEGEAVDVEPATVPEWAKPE